jgi:hypothetical protein
MKLLALYILLSFIGIAVLGFTGLITHDSLFSRCVAATLPGGLPCDGQDIAASGVMASIYQGFSLAFLSAIILLAFALVAFCRASTHQTRAQIASIVSKLESKTHSSIIKYNLWSELNQQHPARF